MLKLKMRSLLLAATFIVPIHTAAAESLLWPEAEQALPGALTEPASDTELSTTLKPKGTRLIPFAEPASEFQMTGEVDSSVFTFRLDADQAVKGGDLVLAYKNAVSVLPDDGVMSVEVNGKPAGQFEIASPFNVTQHKIRLSSRQLVEGDNAVRISVVQHHRVDCSLEATYELWTHLSPGESGFLSQSAHPFSSFADLRSVGRMEDGATELRLVMPGKSNADMLDAASAITQTMALYLGREDVIVTVADRPGSGPGIDLFAGYGSADPAAAGGMRIYAEAPYGVTVKPSEDPERAAVIFRADSVEGMNNQLLEAVRGPMAKGLQSVRDARHFGRIDARADKSFTLADVGIRSTTFSGRLMRTQFEMVMPADFYPAEYATLDLRLSAATAPGLEPSSQMLVRINDKVVNSFPFRNTDGQTFNGKLIELPLRAFRPGVNKVEMIAELSNAADKACSPQTRNDQLPRYVLLDQTSFSIPPLARVTRLPDLGAFAGNAYPYASGRPFDVHLGNPDSHSASTAMTVLARLAMTAGRPLEGNFKLAMPAPDARTDALVISAQNQQARADETSGIKTAAFFRLDEDAAQIMKTDRIATASVLGDDTQNPGSTDQLIRTFQDQTAENGAELSWMARFKSLIAAATGRFGDWLSYEDKEPAQIRTSDTLLAIVQMARPKDAGVVTEISAASPEDLSRGIRRLAEPEIWNRLDGGAAVIDTKSMGLVTLAGSSQRFIDVTDQSVGNYRRIAAAWLSDNFQAYVAIVILMIGIFAAWLGKLVQRKGVRTDI